MGKGRNDRRPIKNQSGSKGNNKSGNKKNFKGSKKNLKNEHSVPFKRNPLAEQWQPDCPICGKTVRNLNIAIEEKETKQPAHFECVMQKIGEDIELAPGERLHYLGSGSFGIVKFEEGKGLSSYTIIRRIPYEDRENKSDWRKKIYKYVEN